MTETQKHCGVKKARAKEYILSESFHFPLYNRFRNRQNESNVRCLDTILWGKVRGGTGASRYW